jgi:hypothetical protein
MPDIAIIDYAGRRPAFICKLSDKRSLSPKDLILGSIWLIRKISPNEKKKFQNR